MGDTNFWSDASVEPKRSFRWLFQLGIGTDSKIESYFCKSVKKPSFAINEIEHQYVSHRFYYPGRVTWNVCEVTFVDPVDPDTSAILSNIVVAAGYKIPITPLLAQSSLSKKKFTDNVGNPLISVLDGDGKPVEEWSLWNAWVTALDYGSLDYSTDELTILSLTLRYDYATMSNAEGGTPKSQLSSS